MLNARIAMLCKRQLIGMSMAAMMVMILSIGVMNARKYLKQ